MTGHRAGAWRDVAVGARAAWLAPRAIARSLPSLLALPAAAARESDAPHPGAEIPDPQPPDPRRIERVLRRTARALALLSRIPGGYWRGTCLYRSAAECLALRALGVPARMVIGVGRAAGESPREPAHAAHGAAHIRAHAWVAVGASAPNDVDAFAALTGPTHARGHAAG